MGPAMAEVLMDVGQVPPLLVMAVGAAVAAFLARIRRQGASRRAAAQPGGGQPAVRGPVDDEAGTEAPGEAPGPPYLGLILQRASELGERYEYGAASRRALLHDPLFTTAV